MKTALYGIVSALCGLAVYRYSTGWPLAYSILVTTCVGIGIACVGYLMEALVLNSFIWGDDRYDHE